MTAKIVKLSEVKNGDCLEIAEDFYMFAIQDAEKLTEDMTEPYKIPAGEYLVITDTDAYIHGDDTVEMTVVSTT